MKQYQTPFSDEEKQAIIDKSTKENGDFDYKHFLELVAAAKIAKGEPES